MGQLTLTFEWDGVTVHKETKGFKGGDCIKKTKFIEDALGTAGDRKLKAEYYAEEEQTEQQRNTQRN